jgi:hypothetical protein
VKPSDYVIESVRKKAMELNMSKEDVNDVLNYMLQVVCWSNAQRELFEFCADLFLKDIREQKQKLLGGV